MVAQGSISRRRSTTLAALAVVFLAATATPAQSGGHEDHGDTSPHQEEESCNTVETTRESVDSYLADDGRDRSLRALILVDGASHRRAEEVVAEAIRAYAPLGIHMSARYRPVKLNLDPDVRDPLEFIEEARRLVGGRRPQNTDLVYLLTTRDMAGKGYAACIGGIAFPTEAFATGEADSGPPEITRGEPVPAWPWGDGTAHTFAHEVGHLMGGQHDLSNCVEGLLSPSELPSPCTVMDPRIGTAMWFSTANAIVVRGHAVAYLEELE